MTSCKWNQLHIMPFADKILPATTTLVYKIYIKERRDVNETNKSEIKLSIL